MDKNKTSTYILWILISIMLALEVINLFSIPKIPDVLEENKDYRFGWRCDAYKFKSADDAEKGWNCLLEQCEIVSSNPRTEECICVLNNLTVNKVCIVETYSREFPYPTYNRPQKINVTQKEFDDIVSGEKNLSDVI